MTQGDNEKTIDMVNARIEEFGERTDEVENMVKF